MEEIYVTGRDHRHLAQARMDADGYYGAWVEGCRGLSQHRTAAGFLAFAFKLAGFANVESIAIGRVEYLMSDLLAALLLGEANR